MKKTGWIILVLVLCAGCYSLWVYNWTYRGASLGRVRVEDTEVEVLRMPYEFSLVNPLYGKRMFPGYILIRVSNRSGWEISSYAINWESFYPDDFTAMSGEEGQIVIEMLGQKIVFEKLEHGLSWKAQ